MKNGFLNFIIIKLQYEIMASPFKLIKLHWYPRKSPLISAAYIKIFDLNIGYLAYFTPKTWINNFL